MADKPKDLDRVTSYGTRAPSPIDSFVSSLKKHGGLATGNRFRVQFTTSELGYQFKLTQEESMLISNVNIPLPTYNFFMYRNASPTIRFPHEIFFEPLTMEFYCFEDNGQPFGKFAEWNRQLFADGSVRMRDYNWYAEGKNCIVTEFNRFNDAVAKFTFYNLYPTSINKTLSYEHRSSPEKISVSFAYEYSTYEHEETT